MCKYDLIISVFILKVILKLSILSQLALVIFFLHFYLPLLNFQQHSTPKDKSSELSIYDPVSTECHYIPSNELLTFSFILVLLALNHQRVLLALFEQLMVLTEFSHKVAPDL